MSDKTSNILGDNPKVSFLLGLFIGVAAFSTISALIFMVAFFTGKNTTFSAGEEAAEVAAADVDLGAEEPADEVAEVPAVTADDHIKGPENAKVTLIEYSDFECPYCANHYDTSKQILENFGDDVRLIFRHFPLSFHPNAQGAALASECAAEQGKFWEMYDKIFAANKSGTMSIAAWKQAAKDLGLDTTKFNDCLDTEKYADQITAQMQDALEAGVGGTPATFVNGYMVSGALPYESFAQIIEAELE
ncbi:DsbA family protein [Patescibacteria group bacterium]|nr:DsbA family protein [Patescibacteria group bacterium]MBU1921640.1 DsbA family protein [Patescibacteria group bacterium]